MKNSIFIVRHLIVLQIFIVLSQYLCACDYFSDSDAVNDHQTLLKLEQNQKSKALKVINRDLGIKHAENEFENPIWAKDIDHFIEKKIKDSEAEVSLYFKDLEQNYDYGYNEEELVYLASGFKILILLEIFRQFDAGLLKFDDYLHYSWDDVRDGAPNMNRRKIGLSYSVAELVKAMIQDSDNAASDLLIKKLGIYNIEKNLVNEGYRQLGPLVKLIDVRMGVYSQLDPRATSLQMWQVRDVRWRNGFEPRLDLLQKHIGPPYKKYGAKELDEAYDNYYAQQRNHASMKMIGSIFENLHNGNFISAKISKAVIGILEGAYSSGHRIRGAIPEQFTIAHKTGTQHERICDLSLVTLPDGQKFILNIAVKNVSVEEAEAILQKTAKKIWTLVSQDHRKKK